MNKCTFVRVIRVSGQKVIVADEYVHDPYRIDSAVIYCTKLQIITSSQKSVKSRLWPDLYLTDPFNSLLSTRQWPQNVNKNVILPPPQSGSIFFISFNIWEILPERRLAFSAKILGKKNNKKLTLREGGSRPEPTWSANDLATLTCASHLPVWTFWIHNYCIVKLRDRKTVRAKCLLTFFSKKKVPTASLLL